MRNPLRLPLGWIRAFRTAARQGPGSMRSEKGSAESAKMRRTKLQTTDRPGLGCILRVPFSIWHECCRSREQEKRPGYCPRLLRAKRPAMRTWRASAPNATRAECLPNSFSALRMRWDGSRRWTPDDDESRHEPRAGTERICKTGSRLATNRFAQQLAEADSRYATETWDQR
jgi:hypothetical protein